MTCWIPWALTILVTAAVGPDRNDTNVDRNARQGDIETFVARVAQAVDATDEQAAALDAIAKEHKAAVESMRADREQLKASRRDDIDALREQMREARQAGNEEKLKELRGELRQIMGDGSQRRLMRETRQKITAVLNTEQRIKFEEMVADLGGRGKQRNAGDRRGGGTGGSRIYQFVRRLAEEVNATEEQRQALRRIAADHIRAVKAAEAEAEIAREEGRERLGALPQELREARRSGDQEKARELQKQIRGMMGTPRRDIIKQTHDRIVEVLTAEQMPKFEAMTSELRKTVGEPRGAERAKRQHVPRQPAGGPDKANSSL